LVAREGLMRGVLDFSAVEAVAVSSARLVARGQRQSILQDENRVFVAPQPEMYQLSRAFADHQRIAGRIEPKVVATLEEAYALLGLQDARFEPVEGP
jgi:hypothetical protein